MPQLKHIYRVPSVHNRAGVDCYDYVNDVLVSGKFCSFKGGDNHSELRFRQEIKDDIPPDIRFRLLVVEDLSPKLIALLGRCLDVSPEFFEEHLLNSGWCDGTYGTYTDPESDTWNTRNMTKDYTSIRWHRLVNRRLPRPKSWQEHRLLLEPSEKPLCWADKELINTSEPCFYSLRSLVNILRSYWETTLNSDSNLAWEERATFWSTQLDSCRLGTRSLWHGFAGMN